ncbi:11479_t:CDS:10 [Diversispora eburnea]|uniref:Eukaryotic translation initiation factor 2A n=1 Tax=Diversispora eburnea TaxID=1213867 RepID=A0A9N8UZ34_9GLOM|nr:11479_t:CDS:10 [Diversispora eburnea]
MYRLLYVDSLIFKERNAFLYYAGYVLIDRSFNNLVLVSGHPNYQPIQQFQDPGENVKIFQYSTNNKYLGWATSESVKIIDAETTEIVIELPKKNVVEIGFSPKGNYISTWERPVKPQDNSVHKNLIIWEVVTGKELISFTQKTQTNWNVQWTEDESFFSRLVTGEVHFYDTNRIDKGIHNKLRLEGVGDFSLSPGKSPSISIFIPEKNSAPAIVRIYSITNFNSPLSQKTFYKADKIQMKWNDLGTNLLVLTSTDVDKTNKSYYGDKEGPIHDVAWSPTSKEFIVIYGYMPAKATLFNHRADPIHNLAGFGNLAGTMDVWDRKTLGKITTIEAPNSSETCWSPDGRYIITATLSPRLRVDNGFKIWHYTGALVHTTNVQELLQVQWRPANVELYPMRSTLSPPPKALENSAISKDKPTPKKIGAYRPPHARGTATPEIFKREDESNKNSLQDHGKKSMLSSTENTSKAAAKNKKKREAAKKKKEESVIIENTESSVIINNNVKQTDTIVSNDTSLEISENTTTQSGSALSETDKKIRNLTKKLRQIAELKEKQKSGDALEPMQLQKIESEPLLRKELEMLKH